LLIETRPSLASGISINNQKSTVNN